MTRTKVKMALIANDSERKNCYKKRKQSLLKLTRELSTLCGIEACIIVYSQYDAEPHTWPSESTSVENTLGKFSTYPAWKKIKNKVDQKMYMAQRITKAKEHIWKVAKANKEKETEILMLQSLITGTVEPDNKRTVADINNLSSVVEQTLNDISERLESLKINEITPSSQPQMQSLSSEMLTPVAHQPLMQTPVICQAEVQTIVPEEVTVQNDGNGLDVNAYSMEDQWLMYLTDDKWDDGTTTLSSGDANN